MKKILVIVILLAVVFGGWYWWKRSHKSVSSEEVFYRTSPIERRTITQEVTATGTVKAIQEVEVGTQVTGKIVQLFADFNSKVEEGQVVAKIDPETYEASYAAAQAQLDSARASLESAKAQLASAKATLARTEVSLDLAEKELARNEALRNREMISESEYDSSLAERDGLKAQLMGNQASIQQTEATVKQTEANVKQAQANVKQAKTNLDYCTIISPVTGVVLKRSVDEGQTVVSSMNASTLFTIATDLSKIEVSASIPEADIGTLKEGQTVKFTVDAYRETFLGKVKQVRMAATTESNVVTYPVIVEAENPGSKLFPGMTATIAVIVASEENTWAVPTAALRFKPTNQTVPEGKGRCIWIAKTPNTIEPMEVTLGVSDSVFQQVITDEPLDGLNVATGVMTADERKSADDNQVSNPFMMRPPGANRGGNKGGNPPPPPR